MLKSLGARSDRYNILISGWLLQVTVSDGVLQRSLLDILLTSLLLLFHNLPLADILSACPMYRSLRKECCWLRMAIEDNSTVYVCLIVHRTVRTAR